MAGKYSSQTPYNYAFNDPVALNDPMGDDVFNDDISNQDNSTFNERWAAGGFSGGSGGTYGSGLADGQSFNSWIMQMAYESAYDRDRDWAFADLGDRLRAGDANAFYQYGQMYGQQVQFIEDFFNSSIKPLQETVYTEIMLAQGLKLDLKTAVAMGGPGDEPSWLDKFIGVLGLDARMAYERYFKFKQGGIISHKTPDGLPSTDIGSEGTGATGCLDCTKINYKTGRNKNLYEQGKDIASGLVSYFDGMNNGFGNANSDPIEIRTYSDHTTIYPRENKPDSSVRFHRNPSIGPDYKIGNGKWIKYQD